MIYEAEKNAGIIVKETGDQAYMEQNRIVRGIINGLAIFGLLVLIVFGVLAFNNYQNISTVSTVFSLINGFSMYSLDNGKMFDGALNGVVSSTGDPYAQYMNAYEWENMQQDYQGQFGGIGIYIVQDREGRLYIAAPIKDTPAEKAGLKSSDLIMKIDGKEASDMDQDQAVNMIRGEPGSQVTLQIYQNIEKVEKEFVLTRQIIDVPTVSSRVLENHPEIGYIALSQFHSESGREVEKALGELNGQGVKALVLDLRDDTGGDFDAALEIADLFLGQKDIVSEVTSQGKQLVHTGQSQSNDCTLPMVVLTNGFSASASEILAAALQDNDRAVLVGEKTFGKGVIQNIFQLSNGGALKITTEKYLTPGGRDIDRKGIDPDYEVAANIATENDEQLDKAVELLLPQLNPAP